MPRRAPHPCRHPGCAGLVVGAGRYCPEHSAQGDEQVDAQRPTSSQRGYGYRWQKIRAVYLRAHPICADPFGVHQQAGQLAVAAEDVDHITPLQAGGSNRAENLQALCHSCHSRKTATENGGWGRGRQKPGAGDS